MNPLTTLAPNSGISASPNVGFGDIRDLDIFTTAGSVRLNNLMEKKSATTITDTIQWQVKNPATPTEVYALGDTGKVYKSTDSGATWALMTGFTAGGHGNGLAIFKNYLIVARDAFLDVCGDGTATGITNANWTNSWKAIVSDNLWHPMIISNNNSMLYGGAGKYVFSLEELTTFVPATAATFTFTAQALDLPSNYRIKCITELGNSLLFGTWVGVAVTDNRIADIFTWDRSSPSFGQPVKIDENGVHSLLNIGGVVYMQCGIEGKIFITDGVGYSLVGQIPNAVANLDGGKYLLPFPGALVNFKQRPFFGVSFGSGNIGGMGVWSISRTANGNILTLEHQISTGNSGSSNPLQIGSLLALNQDTILVGWRDNATFGIDKLNNSLRATSGYFTSPFYQIGTPLSKKSFTQLEFLLTEALTVGQSIKVDYRTDLSASFVNIGEFSFTVLGGVLSFNATAGIPSAEFIQLKVSLLTGATNTSPILKSITLK